MSIMSQEAKKQAGCVLHWTGAVASSNSPKAITAYGNATQTNAIADPWGGTRNVAYFDGTGDYLVVTHSSDLNLGSNNFSITAWIKSTATGSNSSIFGDDSGASKTIYTSYVLQYITTGAIRFVCFDSSASKFVDITSSVTIKDGIWHYCEISRSGANWYLFIDGTLRGSATSSNTIRTHNASGIWFIGAKTNSYGEYSYFMGYIGEIRVNNGVVGNISSYTPPTIPFKPDPNTKLLLHMDGVGNAFYDSSDPPGDNGFPILPDGVTITPTGTFTIEKMKDGRNVWKFDGSTNYITISDHASWSMFLNDFTIAGWVKLDSVAANKVIIGQYVDANNQWYLQWTTSNIIQLYGIKSSTARFDFSCPLTAVTNTWYHIVVQRSGSSCIMYINGGAQTVTQTTAFSATATDIAAVLSIGKINTGYQTGNIKDLQIFTKALTMDQISALYQETYIY